MTPTPPISRWRRLARSLTTPNPPWWGSAWVILLIALLWYPLTAPLRKFQTRPMLEFSIWLAPAADGTWRLLERKGDAPTVLVSYKVVIDEGKLWTRYRLQGGAILSWSVPPMPTLAGAAAAWRAADEQTREAAMPGVEDYFAPVSVGDILGAYGAGRSEMMLGQRWYALGDDILWVRPALFLVAFVLGFTRSLRKQFLIWTADAIKANLCAHCRYSLDGLAPSALCPECGADNQAMRQAAFAELDLPPSQNPETPAPSPPAQR